MACAALWAWADSFVRIVRVSYVAAPVNVDQPGPNDAGTWTTGLLNAPVVEGEKIKTGLGGRAEVQFECGSVVRLAPESEIKFSQLRLNDQGVRESTTTLDRGTLFATLGSKDSPGFTIKVAGDQVLAPGGDVRLRVDATADHPPSIEVLDGKATVQAGGKSFLLNKAQRLLLRGASSPEYAAAAPADAMDQWSLQRDDAFERALDASAPKPPIDASQAAPPRQQGTALTPGQIQEHIIAGDLFETIDKEQGRNGIESDPMTVRPAHHESVPFCAGN